MFVYAGVAINEDRASQLHAEAISRFRIIAQELKGSNLIRSSRGRRAISWILAEASQYSRVMVANKEYALAGKFLSIFLSQCWQTTVHYSTVSTSINL